MNGREVAKKFWENKTSYPAYGNIKQRRLHELNYLLPRLKGETLADVGCGDGALLNCLYELTDMSLIGLDLSEKLMERVNPRIPTQVYDCYKPWVIDLDVTILGGVIQYLFEDKAVEKLLGAIHSPLLFVRTACTLENEDQLINKESVKLGEQYASIYRTLNKTSYLLSKYFEVVDTRRIYPDKIESEFGTKQFYFECRRRDS